MRIRMVKLAAGPAGVWPAGTEVVVDDAVGRQMCESGAAVPVTDPHPGLPPGRGKGVETAMVGADEVRVDHEEGENERKAQNAKGAKAGKTSVTSDESSPIDPMPNNAEDEDAVETDEDERPKRRTRKPRGGKKPFAG